MYRKSKNICNVFESLKMQTEYIQIFRNLKKYQKIPKNTKGLESLRGLNKGTLGMFTVGYAFCNMPC